MVQVRRYRIIDVEEFADKRLEGADLTGTSWANANLENRNLKGANLSNACLRGANLRRAQLDGAILREADLRGAQLRGASLHDADLAGTNFFGADLSRTRISTSGSATFSLADLRYANLSSAVLSGTSLAASNLRGANLAGADLRECDLSWVNLRDVNLSGADVRKANLREAWLIDTNLSAANLRGSKLRAAWLMGARLEQSKTWGADMTSATFSRKIPFPPRHARRCGDGAYLGVTLGSRMPILVLRYGGGHRWSDDCLSIKSLGATSPTLPNVAHFLSDWSSRLAQMRLTVPLGATLPLGYCSGHWPVAEVEVNDATLLIMLAIQTALRKARPLELFDTGHTTTPEAESALDLAAIGIEAQRAVARMLPKLQALGYGTDDSRADAENLTGSLGESFFASAVLALHDLEESGGDVLMTPPFNEDPEFYKPVKALLDGL